MSNPEDRGEPGRGRRPARPSGDADGQGGPSSWPSRYGPPPDFTLPPDTIGTLPGDDAPAQRPTRPASSPADSGWFTSPTDATPAYRDPISREAPAPGDDTQSYSASPSRRAPRPAGDTQAYGSSQPRDVGRSNGDAQPYAASQAYDTPSSPDPAQAARSAGSQDPAQAPQSQDPDRPYEGTRRSGRPEASTDAYTQPGRRRRPDSSDPSDVPPPGDTQAPHAPQARRSPSGPQARQSPASPPASRTRSFPPDPPAPQAQPLPPTPGTRPLPPDTTAPRARPNVPASPATQAQQNPWAPPASQAPRRQPGFVPHDQASQPGYDDAGYDQPAGYTGRRGRNPDPDDYDFDGRDGYSGPGDPYAERDGYANRADPHADRDSYTGRQDQPPDDRRYDYDESVQHVAGPGRATSRGAAPAEPEPQWDDEDGYDEDRFVPGLGGGRRDDEYDGAGAGRGRGGHGGRSGRGGSSGGTGKRRRRWLVPLVVILVVLLIPVGVGGFYVYRTVQNRYYPADYSTAGAGQTSVIVQVQDGQTATEVGQRLVTLGVVKSVRAFELAAEHSTSSSTLEPGFYRMKKQMKATLAYQLLLSPSSRVQDKITIPEGLRLTQIEAQLGAHSGIPLADYQQALKSPGSLGLPSYANGKPEGYLFPATYEVQPKQTATNVLQGMVARFNQEADSDNLVAASAAVHMTAGQIITVASLIQAEGGSTTYYARIARVIYNRLNDHMKLQLDSTVMYGLNTFGIIASNQQLQSNSPYNTYKFAGLPPGPIDSPGHAAIEAALHPASGNDLYFVTTNPKTGLTQFTSSQTQFEQFRQELEKNLGK